MKKLILKNIYGKPIKFNIGYEGLLKYLRENGIVPQSEIPTPSALSNVIDSSDDKINYVVPYVMKGTGDFMLVSDYDALGVGGTIPTVDGNENAINPILDDYINDGETFLDSLTGKIVKVNRDNTTGEITINSISEETPDPTIVYHALSEGVDLYYHYVPVANIGANALILNEPSTRWKLAVLYVGTVKVAMNTADEVNNGTTIITGMVDMNPSRYCVDESGVNALNVTTVSSLSYKLKEAIKVVPVTGRFKAMSSSTSISIPSGYSFSSKNPDLEADHLYEYSIFDGICNITDVTPAVI